MALRRVCAEVRINAKEGLDQSRPAYGKLLQLLIDLLQQRQRTKVNSFFEGKTHRFEILTDFRIEVADRFVLVAIEKPLRDAEQRLIGIDFDLGRADLPRIAKTCTLDFDADRSPCQILTGIVYGCERCRENGRHSESPLSDDV